MNVHTKTAYAQTCLLGDINGFLFPSGGAEANEAAVRIARRYTGRHKILTQYRSYHGATSGAIAATGDFRRLYSQDAPETQPRHTPRRA